MSESKMAFDRRALVYVQIHNLKVKTEDLARSLITIGNANPEIKVMLFRHGANLLDLLSDLEKMEENVSRT